MFTSTRKEELVVFYRHWIRTRTKKNILHNLPKADNSVFFFIPEWRKKSICIHTSKIRREERAREKKKKKTDSDNTEICIIILEMTKKIRTWDSCNSMQKIIDDFFSRSLSLVLPPLVGFFYDGNLPLKIRERIREGEKKSRQYMYVLCWHSSATEHDSFIHSYVRIHCFIRERGENIRLWRLKVDLKISPLTLFK